MQVESGQEGPKALLHFGDQGADTNSWGRDMQEVPGFFPVLVQRLKANICTL